MKNGYAGKDDDSIKVQKVAIVINSSQETIQYDLQQCAPSCV